MGRLLALVLVPLLSLAATPLALADEGPAGSSVTAPPPFSAADCRDNSEACQRYSAWCRDHRDQCRDAAAWCREQRAECREWRDQCREDGGDPSRCFELWCAEHPDASSCKRSDGVKTMTRAGATAGVGSSAEKEQCDARVRAAAAVQSGRASTTRGGDGGDTGTDGGAGSDNGSQTDGSSDGPGDGSSTSAGSADASGSGRCKMLVALARGEQHDWVAFDLSADGYGLTNYTVHGQAVLSSVRYLQGAPETQAHRDRHRLVMDFGDDRLVVHDGPTGLLLYNGDGLMQFSFAAGSTLDHTGEGTRVQLPWGGTAFVLSPSIRWEGTSALVRDHAVLHLQGPGATGHQPAVGSQLRTAVERGHVAAEVDLRAEAAEQDNASVYAYDDVSARVMRPPGLIRVEVSAELAEGRTIALHLDASAAAQPYELRYYDVHFAGDGTPSDTEVVFRAAADLQDVLDATDDGGQPEYWTVSDPNGLQVLVSVPHWSVHAITLQSLVDDAQPVVLVGVLAGVAATAVAAVGLFRTRRKEEVE